MAIRNIEITDFPCSSYDGRYGYTGDLVEGNKNAGLASLGFTLNNAFDSLPTVSGSSGLYDFKTYPNGMIIHGGKYQSGSGWVCQISIKRTNDTKQYGGYGYLSGMSTNFGVCFAVDDETHKGYVVLGFITQSGYPCIRRTPYPTPSDEKYNILYGLLVGNIPIVYDWSAVPTINGKDGSPLNLSVISNINSGEAVSGASESAFSALTKASKVSKLIDDVMPVSNKVVVKYLIPLATYEYIKLVYKKGSIPSSYSDGTAIDITQSNTEQEISGLADGGTYWFVIFTDKSTSEPKKIKTEDLRPSIIWKTTDVNHNKSVGWNTDITSLSEYYLTDWILCQKQGNGNFITQLGADYGYGRRTSLESGCYMLVPMERIIVSKIRVKAGFTYQVSGQYATLSLSLAYIEDGVLKFVDNKAWNMIGADRVYPLQQFEYVLQNPHYVDYLAIRSCDYQWAFENLEFI